MPSSRHFDSAASLENPLQFVPNPSDAISVEEGDSHQQTALNTAFPLAHPIGPPTFQELYLGEINLFNGATSVPFSQTLDRSPLHQSEQLLLGDLKTTDSLLEAPEVVGSPTEVAFIDAGIENYQDLLDSFPPSTQVIVLDANRDGIQQITESLAGRQKIDAIHLLAHGREGALSLGNSELSAATLDNHAESLQQWRRALTDTADLLVYGCNVAAGKDGETFVEQLSNLTGADIAASDDLTGAAWKGGDWDLELELGEVEAIAISSDIYDGTLASLTIDQVHTQWQSGSLPDFNGIDFTIGDNTLLNGSFSVVSDDSATLVLAGTGLSGFVGTGADTAANTDDTGLNFSNLDASLTLNADGTYNYSFDGSLAVVGIDGLTLSADAVASTGTQASTTVALDSFTLGLGSVAAVSGSTLEYQAENGAISFSGADLYAFAGYGADTTDTVTLGSNPDGTESVTGIDDVGVELAEVTFDLDVTAGGYSYTIQDGSIATRGLDGINISAQQVSASGDGTDFALSTGAATLGLSDGFQVSASALSFSSEDRGSGTTVEFSIADGAAVVGHGASTSDSDDDVGLAITDADVEVALDNDGSYAYSVANGAIAIAGIDGLTVEAGTVNVSGDGSTTTVDLADATVGIKGLVEVSGASLALTTEETVEGVDVSLSATGVDVLAGYGLDTPGTADDVGLAIAGAAFEIDIKGDRAYSYSITDGSVDLRGIPGLTLGATGVAASGDHTGNSFTTSLTGATVGLGDLVYLNAGTLNFETEGTGSDRTLTLDGTNLSGLMGYGAATTTTADDVGVSVSGADFNLTLNSDSTYQYGLANAAVDVLGIPDFTLSAASVNASGDGDNTTLQLQDAAVAIGSVFRFGGESIDLDIDSTTSTIQFRGEGLDAIAGYGADTPNDTSDDVGLSLTNADVDVVLNPDQTYSYSVANADAAINGVPGISFSSSDVSVSGSKTANGNSLDVMAAAAELAVADTVRVSGDAIAFNLTDNQPITISADNAGVLIGAGADTAATSDDVGLSIQNTDFSVTLNADQTYDYSVSNASAGLVGMDGLILTVDDVNVTGNQDTVTVATGAFTLGIEDVGYIQGNGLGYEPADTATDPVLFGAQGITVFVGAGGLTSEEAGIKLSDGTLGLALYNNDTYALDATGTAAVVGMDDLTLTGTLGLRLNTTGQIVDEAIALGTGDTVPVKFEAGQENQARLEGTVDADIDGAVAFGGDFSLEFFTLKTPGQTDLLSGLTDQSVTLAAQDDQAGEAFYQTLLTALTAEKARLEGEQSSVDEITATVDGVAFQEDFVDIAQDRLEFQVRHGFGANQQVVYHANGNADIGGLVDGQTYFVVGADETTLQLSTTANGSAIDLTSVSTGQHQLAALVEFDATNQLNVDTQADQINFGTAHGLADGALVRYSAGNNPVIGGLEDGQDYLVTKISDNQLQLRNFEGAVVDLTSDSMGDHSFQSVTITTSSGVITGDSDAPDGDTSWFEQLYNDFVDWLFGVDVDGDTISFDTVHNLETGDRIQYYKPLDGEAVGGTLDTLLTRQTVYPYTVEKVSDTEIQLKKDGEIVDLTDAGSGFHVMTSMESDRTFRTASNISFVNATTISLGYSHDLVTGQTVSLQIDPRVSYPKTPIAGLTAVSYNAPKGHRATQESIYYVKVAANGNIQFAASKADLDANTFVAIQAPSKRGSQFRLMPTLSFGAATAPTETLGTAVSFDAGNTIRVDVDADTITIPNNTLQIGDAVTYSASGTAIGGLTDGTTYYVASTLNGQVQLAAIQGGTAIDLTSDGGSGTHSVEQEAVEFQSDNDIAQRRRDHVVALQERLSRDLGVTVTLSAGTASEGGSIADRGVTVRDIQVQYDEEQKASTKLLAGINNGYAFVGNDYDTADETGIKIEDTNLGLALFKTIDYAQPTATTDMTYALTGDGAAELVGIPDVTAEGTLAVQFNRTGETVDETITTPGGSINIDFDQPDDITQVSGTALVNIAGLAGISGEFAFEQTPSEFTISGSELAAFVGHGMDTPTEDDDVGIVLSDADLNFQLKADDTYTYDLSNAAIAVRGMPGLTLSADAVNLSGDHTGDDVEINLNNAVLGIDNLFQLSGNDLTIKTEGTGADRTVTIDGTGLSAFFGYGSDTPTDLADDVGLAVSNADFALQINADNTYSYTFSDGSVEARGIPELTLGADDVSVSGNQDQTSVGLTNGELGLGTLFNIQGSAIAFDIETTPSGKTIAFEGSGLAGFAGYGADTATEADDMGVGVSNASLTVDLEADGSYSYDLSDADMQVRGIDGITLDANDVSVQGDGTNLTINTADVTVGMGNAIRVSSDALAISAQEGQPMTFEADNASAVVGSGASTADPSDDVGLSVSNIDFDLTLNTDDTYDYTLSNANAALVGIDDVTLSVEDVSVVGDETTLEVTTGNFDLSIPDVVTLSGTGLAFDPSDSATDPTRIGAEGITTFVGTGEGTPDAVGISLTNGELGLMLNNDGTYALVAEGVSELVGLDDIDLSGDVGLRVNNTGAVVNEAIATTNGTVELTFDQPDDITEVSGTAFVNIAGLAAVSGEFTFEQTTDEFSISGSDFYGFVGYGAETAGTIDPDDLANNANAIGVEITGQDFSFTSANDDSYTYSIGDGSAAIRGIDGLTLDATGINLNGDNDSVSLTTGDYAVGIENLAAASGTALTVDVVKTAGGETVTFSTSEANLFVGYGAGTDDTDDDVGLEITDANLTVDLEDDGTYSYDISDARVTVKGIDGLELSADSVNASGTPTNFHIDMTDANLGVGGAIDLSVASLDMDVTETADGTEVTFDGTGISAFVGHGAETDTTTDDVGIQLSNADLNFQLNADQTYSYDLSNAAVAVLGIPGLELSSDAVSVSGDHTGNDFDITLSNAVLEVDGLFRLSGDDLVIKTEGTGADRTVTIDGTGLNAFLGYGAHTSAPSDDVGLLVSNADVAFQINGDQTYSYTIENGSLEERGIPLLDLSAGTFSVSGDQDQVAVGITNGELGLGNLFRVEGDRIDFNLEKTVTGSSIRFDGSGLSAFAGYGANTPDQSDDIGVEVSNANLTVNLNNDGSFDYDLTNADMEARGIDSLQLNASDVNVQGDGTNLTVNTGEITLGLGNAISVGGDALDITIQDGQPITINADNARAVVGSGAATLNDPSDDVGLSVSNVNFDLTLNNDDTYDYTISDADAALVGVDGVTLAVQDVNVSGDETTLDVTTGSFGLGINDVGYATGTGLAFDPSDGATDPTRIAAKDITAFVGAGGNTADEAGIKINDANLGLVLYPDDTYALVADGAGELVGVDALDVELTNVALRVNTTGQTVNETIAVSGTESVEVTFTVGQENQKRVEGTLDANVADAVAFGGDFSAEIFTEAEPGAVDQTSALADERLTSAAQDDLVGEAFYQDLLAALSDEKARLEQDNASLDGITATVDGFSFNEDFVDIDQDRLNLQTDHGFEDGQAVVYSANGNGAIAGLQDGQTYIIVGSDAQTLQLATTAGGPAIDLTAAGSGTHSLSPVLDFTASNDIHIDTVQEQIIFDGNHGFSEGDLVRYSSDNNAPIGGLVNGEDYTVTVISPTTIQLKSIDDGMVIDLTADSTGNHSFRTVTTAASNQTSSGGVDTVAETVAFGSDHHLTTGDRVQYYKPVGGRAVGGTLDTLLTKPFVFPYDVVRVSDTEIQLQKDGQTLDLTSAGRGLHVMTSMDTSYRDFYQSSALTFENSTTVKLSYNPGLTTGQTVTLQLKPGSFYRTPMAGLEAVAYSSQSGYSDVANKVYHVQVGTGNRLQFAESAEDLANGNFVSLSTPSKRSSQFRLMPTWTFGSVELPAMTETLGDPVSFAAENTVQVDLDTDAIMLPSPVDYRVGEAVEYQTSGSAIGGLTNGTTYYIASNLNGAIKLSASNGGAVIDLISDGDGTHQFVQASIEFQADNDIAERRRANAIALQDRLSRDLGITVTLNEGDAEEGLSALARGVKIRDITVQYDEEQKATTKLLFGINDGYAFVGENYDTADEAGAKLSDINLGLALYKTIDYAQPNATTEMTYALTGNGDVELQGLPGISLSGSGTIDINQTGQTIAETITTPGGTVELEFAQPDDIILASGTGIDAFVGLGAETTSDDSDDIGVEIENGTFNFALHQPTDTQNFIAYTVEGDVAFKGVDALTLSGTVAAQYNNAPFEVTIDGQALAANLTEVTGTGVTIGMAALDGLADGGVTGDIVFNLADDGSFIGAASNVQANISLAGANIGGSVDGSGGSSGLLQGKLEDGALGVVFQADGQYAMTATGAANLNLGGVVVGGDVGLEIVNVDETVPNPSFSIDQDIEVGNQTISVQFTDEDSDRFDLVTDNLYIDLLIEESSVVGKPIRDVLKQAATYLQDAKDSLDGSFIDNDLPIADTSVNDILGIDDYLNLGTEIQNYLDTDDPADTSDQSLLGLISHLETEWLPTLPVYEGLTFEYIPDDGDDDDNDGDNTFTLSYQSSSTYTESLDLNLGAEADQFGIELATDATIELNVTPAVDFDLVFDWSDDATEAVDFNLNDLSFAADASVDDLVMEAYFGSIGASIGSHDAGKQKATVDLSFAGNATYLNDEFNFSVSDPGTLDVNLPFYASLGGKDIPLLDNSQPPTVTINGTLFKNETIYLDQNGSVVDSSGNLYTSEPTNGSTIDRISAGDITFGAENFDRLINFRNFGIVDTLLMFKDVVAWAEEYREYEVMETSIPFVDLSLGDALDFASALDEQILDKIDFYQPRVDLLTDNGASLSFDASSTPGQTKYTFTDSDQTFTSDHQGQYLTIDGVGIFQITNVSGQTLTLQEANDDQTLLFEADEALSLDLLEDAGAIFGSLSYSIHEKQELIRTYQELLVAINESGILPLSVPLEYDATENTLTIPLAFDYDQPILTDIELDLGLELGDLTLESDAKTSLSASVNGSLDIVIDFDGRTLLAENGTPLTDGNGDELKGIDLFLDNIELKGEANFDVTDLEVSAEIGFVGATAGGAGTGSGIHLGAEFATGISGRHSFSDITGGSLLDNFYLNVDGDASATLKGLSVDAGIITADLSDAELGVYLPSIQGYLDNAKLPDNQQVSPQVVHQAVGTAFDLQQQLDAGLVSDSNLVVVLPDVSDLLSLKNLSFEDIISGIRLGIQFIDESLEDQAFYTAALPLINRSLEDTFSFMDDIAAGLESAAANPAGLLADVETTIESALGLPEDLFTLSLDNEFLNINFRWQALLSESYDFSLDLSSLPGGDVLDGISSLADINGGGDMLLEAVAKLNFDVGINLDSLLAGTPEIVLKDYDSATSTGTHALLGARIEGTDLELGFNLGPINFGTESGFAVLDGDGAVGKSNDNDYAGLLVVIDQQGGTQPDDGYFYLTGSQAEDFSDNFDASIQGNFDVELPLFIEAFGFKHTVSPLTVSTNQEAYGDQALSELFKYLGGKQTPGAADALLVDFPDLQSEFALLGGDFSLLSILNDPSFILDGIDTAVGVLEETLDSNLAQDIPLVGDKLGRAASFLRDMRQGLLSDLRQKLEGEGAAIELIRSTLGDVLGDNGLGLLLDRDGDGDRDADDVLVGWYDVSGNLIKEWVLGDSLPKDAAGNLADAIQFDFDLGGTIIGAGLDLPLDFDLPGFSLDIDGGFGLSMDWSLDFGFGLSVTDTFYLTTNTDSSDKELELNIDVFLDGDTNTVSTPEDAESFSASGQLLFFKADVVDEKPDGKASGVYGGLGLDIVGDDRGRLTFNRILSTSFTDLFDVDFGVDAKLDLQTTLQLDGVDGLPKLRGDVEIDWNWRVGQEFTAPGVNINELEVDLGSYVGQFLQPIAEKIEDAIKPLEPVINVLTEEVGGLDVVLDDPTLKGLINLILQLKGRKPIDWSFLDEAKQMLALVEAVSNISVDNPWLPLGDIAGLGTDNPTSTPTTLSQAELDDISNNFKADGKPVRQATVTSGSTSTPRSGFQVFPYLKDISNWMNLMSGGDATLFTYELPLLEFSADVNVLLFTYGIPKVASLDVNAIAGFSAAADLGFGYDTYGIRKSIDTGNPLYALDGFFLMDYDLEGNEKPEFMFDAYIGLEGSVNLAVARGGLRGKVGLDVDIDLQDIQKSILTKDDDGYVIDQQWEGDGKIRGSEIFTMLTYDANGASPGPQNLFNVDGEIYVEASAFGDIYIPLKGWTGVFDKTLFRATLLELDYDAPIVQPEIASVENGVLYLNAGERANQRQFGDTTDGGEQFFLYTDKSNGQVGVEFDGYYKTFSGVNKVIAYGGEGDDTFDASRLDDIAVEFHGGTGADTLISGSGPATFYGGDGTDILDASRSTRTANLHGEGGDDTITGGTAADNLYGGGGDDVVSGGAGNDLLDGGDGADSMSGGEGEDQFILEDDFSRDRWDDTGATGSYDLSRVTKDLKISIGALNMTVGEVGSDNELKVNGAGVAALNNIKLGSGSDEISISRRSISQTITIDGGGGNDRITIDDVGTEGGTLNGSQVLGLGMGGTINYHNFEDLELRLGSSGDAFTIDDTHNGETTIFTGGGADDVVVNMTSGETTINTDSDNDTVIIHNTGATTTVNAGDNNDIVNIFDTGAGTLTTINGDRDNDSVNVEKMQGDAVINGGEDNDMTWVRNASGTVNDIAGLLTINGDDGADLAFIDDSGEAQDDAGQLTSDFLSGLGLGQGIQYTTLESLNIWTGTGSDDFTIDSTHTTETALKTSTGTDNIYVNAISGETTLKAGSDSDWIEVGHRDQLLDNIAATLTIKGGVGDDIVMIRDLADTTDNVGYLGDDGLSGLGMIGEINYGSIEFLDMRLGSGFDDLTITDTHKTVTQIDLGLGGDTAHIQGVSGDTSIGGGTGSDIFQVTGRHNDLNQIQALLTVKGGLDDDILNVSDLGSEDDDAGILSENNLSGLGMMGQVDYGGIELLDLTLSTGQNDLTVVGTHKAQTLIDTAAGDDRIAIATIAGETTLKSGDGNDITTVSSEMQTLDDIDATLDIKGGSGIDYVSIDDSGDTSDNVGVLSDRQVTGLDMAGRITYGTIEELDLRLGNGLNRFSITNTHLAQTRVYTGHGDDAIMVDAIAGETVVKTGDGSDIVTVGGATQSTANIRADLILQGSVGEDFLTIINSADDTNQTATVTDSTIAGLNMDGQIQYGSFESVGLQLGAGHDYLTVENTFTGDTTFDTGDGDDIVILGGASGNTTVKLGDGDDALSIGNDRGRVNHIAAPVLVKGGLGRDSITFNNTGETEATNSILVGGYITGLGMEGEVELGTVEAVTFRLGTGDDTITIADTLPGETTLNTNDGNDQIFVEAIAGTTTLKTGRGDDVITVSNPTQQVNTIRENLVVQGGVGEDALVVDDSGSEGDRTAQLSDKRVVGLQMGSTIDYHDLESVEVRLGSGNDAVTVYDTHDETTVVQTNEGDDHIEVRQVQGPTIVDGALGADILSLGQSVLDYLLTKLNIETFR